MAGLLSPLPVETRPGWFEQFLTRKEAIKRVNTLKRGRRVFLHVMQEGKIDADTFVTVSNNVRVSVVAAVDYLENTYTDRLMDKGARIQLTWCDSCLFVG